MGTFLECLPHLIFVSMYWQVACIGKGRRSLRFASVAYIRYYACLNIAKWFCSVKLLCQIKCGRHSRKVPELSTL